MSKWTGLRWFYMSLTAKYKITHKLFPLKISILYNLCMYVSPFFFAMGKRYWTEKQPWYIKPTIKKLDYVNFKLLIPEKKHALLFSNVLSIKQRLIYLCCCTEIALYWLDFQCGRLKHLLNIKYILANGMW